MTAVFSNVENIHEFSWRFVELSLFLKSLPIIILFSLPGFESIFTMNRIKKSEAVVKGEKSRDGCHRWFVYITRTFFAHFLSDFYTEKMFKINNDTIRCTICYDMIMESIIYDEYETGIKEEILTDPGYPVQVPSSWMRIEAFFPRILCCRMLHIFKKTNSK